MGKVLIVSVGGSCEPIVTAIKKIQPDRVVFLCSGGESASSSISQVIGEGTPCELRKGTEVIKKEPNILVQTNFNKRFNKDTDLIIVEDPDEINDCYKKIEEKIIQIKDENPDYNIIADYTGGTKTMSAALAMAALDYNISALYVTTSKRRDLIRVESGQFPRRVMTSIMHHKRRLKQIFPKMLKKFNYPAAIEEIETVLMECELSNKENKTIKENLDYVKGLDAWDCFDHIEALKLLEPMMGKDDETKSLVMFLKRVIASRKIIDEDFRTENVKSIKGHGYEVVEDLLLNAERRACQKRFDDAVGRIYRALELMAQIRLKIKFDLLTGDIDINNLNLKNLAEELKANLEKKRNDNGRIQIALRDSFNLLNDLGDEIGVKFKKTESHIIDTLKIRNNSLFAHGFRSITESDYKRIKDNIVSFIEDGIKQLAGNQYRKPNQFPETLNLEI